MEIIGPAFFVIELALAIAGWSRSSPLAVEDLAQSGFDKAIPGIRVMFVHPAGKALRQRPLRRGTTGDVDAVPSSPGVERPAREIAQH